MVLKEVKEDNPQSIKSISTMNSSSTKIGSPKACSPIKSRNVLHPASNLNGMISTSIRLAFNKMKLLEKTENKKKKKKTVAPRHKLRLIVCVSIKECIHDDEE